jgi:hypothetical protein
MVYAAFRSHNAVFEEKGSVLENAKPLRFVPDYHQRIPWRRLGQLKEHGS